MTRAPDGEPGPNGPESDETEQDLGQVIYNYVLSHGAVSIQCYDPDLDIEVLSQFTGKLIFTKEHADELARELTMMILGFR